MAMNPVKNYNGLAEGMVASIKQTVVPPVPAVPVKEAELVKEAEPETAVDTDGTKVTDRKTVRREKPAEAPANVMARMPEKVKREKRTEVIFVKVTPTIRKNFDALCKKNSASQADLISYWIELATNSK